MGQQLSQEQSQEQQIAQMSEEELEQRGFKEPKRAQVMATLDIEGLAAYIANARHGKRTLRNVIVLAGAGISVSAGIPDFRTPGTGLYDNLQKYDLPDPQAIFDINFFKNRPSAFYTLAKEMWAEGVAAGKYKPTPAHRFIKLLNDKGLLLRCYTQNIDSLEAVAGLPLEKIVAAHGNFDSATCITNGKSVPVEEVKQAIIHGEEGEEGWGVDGLQKKYGGLCKPDITFFGEALPERFHALKKVDFPKCDLLIVMGTSLAVQPFADLMHHVGATCPRVLVNRDAVGLRSSQLPPTVGDFQIQAGNGTVMRVGEGFRFEQPAINYRDIALLGDCDSQVARLSEMLGWDQELGDEPPLEASFNDLKIGGAQGEPVVGEKRLGVTVQK